MKSHVNSFVKKNGIFLVLVALCVLFTILNPVFISSKNLLNIMRQMSMIGIASVGGMLVLVSGGIDLSSGAIVSFVDVLVASLMMNRGVSPLPACLAGLAFSAIVGYLNGCLVTGFFMPPLIVTLAMQGIIFGVAYIITNSHSIPVMDDSFRVIGQGYAGKIPVPAIIMVAVFILGWFILNKTYFGRHIYAIGGNADAARLSGIKVNRVRRLVYTLSGLFSGFAGIIYLSRLMSAQPNTGKGFEMDLLTAMVLGGISVNGGSGKIYNAIAGMAIIGVLNNGLVLVNVNEHMQEVIKGIVLIVAVAFDCFSKARAEKKKATRAN